MEKFRKVKYRYNRLKIFLNDEQIKWLRDEEAKNGIKKTDYIRDIIKQIINEHKTKKNDTI